MKKLNKVTLIITLLLSFNFLGKNYTVKATKNLATSIEIVTSLDYENLGNSADIEINYNILKDITTIKEVRLFISTSSEMTANHLLKVSNYQLMPVSESVKTMLTANLNDTNGNLVTEGKSYTIYLLGIIKGQKKVILSNPKLITLTNKTVVTTPKITGEYKAQEDLVITKDGTLYVNEGHKGTKLFKITPDGKSSVLSNAMEGPVGITLDKDENIYTSSYGNTVIKKTTPLGVVSNYATDARLKGGGGLVFDVDGNLFNTYYGTTSLFKITHKNVENLVSSSSFNGPVGITYNKEQNKLYVGSFKSGKIFLVSNTGNITEIVDTDLSIGHLSYANNYIYATGWEEHKVYKISLGGKIISKIGTGNNVHIDGFIKEASFTQPNGIEATEDGKYIYITQGNGKLRKIILAREN